MLPIHRILCPTDFSRPAEHAFAMACSLARDHGAQVLVLHVVEPVLSYGVEIPPPPPDYTEKIWESFRRLQETEPHLRELRVDTRLAEGDPAREILREALEEDCDLIVMGTHGRTGLKRLLMGSVAEQVLRKARCPVLTVKNLHPEAAKKPETVAAVAV